MNTFAEFFAGVGLVHEALGEKGWECLWANDICKDKKETYIANFGQDSFWLGDVWDVVKTPSVIPAPCFLYTASFPCTDMSLAGERRGLDGEESGTLRALLEIVKSKRATGKHPYLIMLENVQGFLTSKKGADVAYTVESLNDLGYVVDLIELDAIHFTPQSRPRVFLFALREEVAYETMLVKDRDAILDSWWSIFESNPQLRTAKIKALVSEYGHLRWGAFNVPKPPKRVVQLADIIEYEADQKKESWWNEERKQHLYGQMSDLHKNFLHKMMEKSAYSYGTVYRRSRNNKSAAELRVDGIAGCLRTPRGGSSKQILVRAGNGDWGARLLTPREYARLQGVGDHYILPENDNKGYFAMGDAVCVPAIRFIADHIINPTYQKVSKCIEKELSASSQKASSDCIMVVA